MTFCPEICVKMFIFKVDVQSDHLETKCSWVKVSQGKNVTVDVSSGSKCYSGQNVGGRNVKASSRVQCREIRIVSALHCIPSFLLTYVVSVFTVGPNGKIVLKIRFAL